MAFIEYPRFSGSGPTPVKPVEGKLGLTVSQWLSNPGSASFGAKMESLVGVSWDTVIKRWFNKAAPFDTLYDDMSQLCTDIDAWYEVRKPSWERMKASLNAEYNPLENYDRIREGVESDVNGTVDIDYTGHDDTNTDSTSKVAPYDSATFYNDNSLDSDTTTTYNSSDSHETHMKTEVDVRDHGNVGVTTNQQMIQEELMLRASYLLGIIIKEFKCEFCVCLYN